MLAFMLSSDNIAGVSSMLALVAAAWAVLRSQSMKTALSVSRETVGVLEEARKVEQTECNRRITALEAEVSVLKSGFVADTTRIVLDSMMNHMAKAAAQLVAGQKELLDAIGTTGRRHSDKAGT